MKLDLSGLDQPAVFLRVEDYLRQIGLRIASSDLKRPWGGFFVIDDKQAAFFASLFFPDERLLSEFPGAKLSPKILLVGPGKRLSWQYHHRRAEIWRVISGLAGVLRSDTDIQGDLQRFQTGQVIRLAKGERHRLVGLEEWGVIAEIWQHTDKDNPSDEDDIVRLQDDFGR